MILISILLALWLTKKALERRAPMSFDNIVGFYDKATNQLQRFSWYSGYAGIALLVAAPVVVFGLIHHMICALNLSIVTLAWYVAALFCCLMANISHEVEGESQGQNNTAGHVIKEAYHRYFGVLFWFIFFGPVGAIAYRNLYLLKHFTVLPGSFHHHSLLALQNAVDWLPVRLVGLLFTLVGDFVNGLSVWQSKVLDADMDNDKFLTQIGGASLSVQAAEGVPMSLAEDAQGLAKRALYLAVSLVGILTLMHVVP